MKDKRLSPVGRSHVRSAALASNDWVVCMRLLDGPISPSPFPPQ